MQTNSNLIALFIGLFSMSLFGQTKDCTCNDLYDKDVFTEELNYDKENLKQFIYDYLMSSTEERVKKKSNFSFFNKGTALLDGIPVVNEISGSMDKSKIRDFSQYKEIEKRGYLTNTDLNIITRKYVPENISRNYDNCLKLCSGVSITEGIGISVINVSQDPELIILELKYNPTNNSSTTKITDVQYTGGTIINGQRINENIILENGDVYFEHIKRKKEESFVATYTFDDGVGSAKIDLPTNYYKKRSTDMPIGSIVTSLLDYSSFLKVNGLVETNDINKMIWAPCDGRSIGDQENTYGALSGGRAPDLRGLFLRGANEIGIPVITTPEANEAFLNPDDTQVGKKQMDAFQGHKHYNSSLSLIQHNKGRPFLKYNDRDATFSTKKESEGKYIVPGYETPRVSKETRPKSMTVYYYVKVR